MGPRCWDLPRAEHGLWDRKVHSCRSLEREEGHPSRVRRLQLLVPGTRRQQARESRLTSLPSPQSSGLSHIQGTRVPVWGDWVLFDGGRTFEISQFPLF